MSQESLDGLSLPSLAGLPGSLGASQELPLRMDWRSQPEQSQHGPSSQPASQAMFGGDQFDRMGEGVPALPEYFAAGSNGSALMGRPPLMSGPGPGLPHMYTQPSYMLEQHGNMIMPSGQPAARHPSVLKVEHKNSKAARRGPMDEMRQLVRILVKLMPESSRFLAVPDEGGGGNRVKEEHIKDYLGKVLGRSNDTSDDAPPYPDWGLANGWTTYLSQLFSWARGTDITTEQALRCARRLPGRSWETINEELEKLRLCPGVWPLPLRKEAIRAVQKVYEATGQVPSRPQQPSQLGLPQQLLLPVPAAAIMATQHVMPAAAPMPVEVRATSPAAPDATGALAAPPPELLPLAAGVEGEPGLKRPLASGAVEETMIPTLATQQLEVPPAATTQMPYSGFSMQPYHPPQPAYATGAALQQYYQSQQQQPGPAQKRRRKGQQAPGVDVLSLADQSELELWHLAHRVLQEAKGKRGTTAPDKIADLSVTVDMVARIANNFTPSTAGLQGHTISAGPAAAAVAPQQHQPGLVAMAAAAMQQRTALGSHQQQMPGGLAGGVQLPSAGGLDAATMQQLKARLPAGSFTMSNLSVEQLMSNPWLHQQAVAAAAGLHGLAAQGLAAEQAQHGQAAAGAPVWIRAPVQQATAAAPAQPHSQQQQQQPKLLLPPAPAAVQAPAHQLPAASATPLASHATVQQQPQQQEPQQEQAQQPHAHRQQQQQQLAEQPAQVPPAQPGSQQGTGQGVAAAPAGPPGGGGVGASGNGGSSSGLGVLKPTVVHDAAAAGQKLAENVGQQATGKEATKEASQGRQGDLRVGSSCGAFRTYDKGGGGLDALAAAAAKLGEKCEGELDEGEPEGRAQAGGQAALPPRPPHSSQQQQQQHRGNDVVGSWSGAGGVSGRHTQEPRKGSAAEGKAGRGMQAAAEEMDETDTKGRQASVLGTAPTESVVEVEGPRTGAQPSISSAPPPRTSVANARSRLHQHLDQVVQNVEERQQQQQQHQHHAAQPPAATQQQQQHSQQQQQATPVPSQAPHAGQQQPGGNHSTALTVAGTALTLQPGYPPPHGAVFVHGFPHGVPPGYHHGPPVYMVGGQMYMAAHPPPPSYYQLVQQPGQLVIAGSSPATMLAGPPVGPPQ